MTSEKDYEILSMSAYTAYQNPARISKAGTSMSYPFCQINVFMDKNAQNGAEMSLGYISLPYAIKREIEPFRLYLTDYLGKGMRSRPHGSPVDYSGNDSMSESLSYPMWADVNEIFLPIPGKSLPFCRQWLTGESLTSEESPPSG